MPVCRKENAFKLSYLSWPHLLHSARLTVVKFSTEWVLKCVLSLNRILALPKRLVETNTINVTSLERQRKVVRASRAEVNCFSWFHQNKLRRKKKHKLISDNYVFAWNLHFFYTLFKSDSIFQPNKQKDKQSAASSVWYQNNTRKWFVSVKFHRSQKPPICIVNVRLSENRQTNWASTNNDFQTGVNRTLKVLKPTWKRPNYVH